jgi:Uma2 family endonuclease
MKTAAPQLSSSPAESRVVLHEVTWKTYQALLADLGERGGTRLSFDNGTLEIMSPLSRHERLKKLLARLIEALSEVWGIPIASAGSTTLSREDLAKGGEPDESYYVQNEAAVRGVLDLKFPRDPPPDLAIEIDITKSSLDCLAIFAALGVQEVWRYDAKSLRIYFLRADGAYEPCEESAAFPGLRAADVAKFLALLGSQDENQIVRKFRAWAQRRARRR